MELEVGEMNFDWYSIISLIQRRALRSSCLFWNIFRVIRMVVAAWYGQIIAIQWRDVFFIAAIFDTVEMIEITSWK
jgi:hypothetical protein